jgi:hypothetical protein
MPDKNKEAKPTPQKGAKKTLKGGKKLGDTKLMVIVN